ncbi:MAG TPA: hypothetical protein VFR23_19450 [Jiangellaceae bacterium]|nr:hypothetical protein [Jiangellaceae bacterium]
MGYAYYVLPDGREAGYGVNAICDRDGCKAQIDRGLDYLCGTWPGDPEDGCGNYFCGKHEFDHDCPDRGDDAEDGPPCCDLHNRNCEPPSELCCWACTEANHPNHLPRERCVMGGGAS